MKQKIDLLEMLVLGLREGWVGGGIMTGGDFYETFAKPVLKELSEESTKQNGPGVVSGAVD